MVKIHLSWPFVAAIPALVFFDREYRLTVMFLSALIHEAGHIFAIAYRKIPIESVCLGICGANINYGKNRLTSYSDDIFIALMGAAFNFAAIGAAMAADRLWDVNCDFFIGVNTLFGVFNLAPVLPLDGGRAFYASIAKLFSENAAFLILKILGTVAGVLGCCIGVLLLIKSKGNFTLLLISSAVLTANLSDTG